MLNLFLVFMAVLVSLFFFWLVYPKRKTDEEKPARYICSQCGDKHCDCHKHEEH